MKKCTFFGHKNTPQEVKGRLKEIIIKLIDDEVSVFYVGTQGQFDVYCYQILKEIKRDYPNIKVYRVLAYMPTDDSFSNDSIYPLGIESVPKKFAISYRNKWMIEKSDYVITYVTHSFGGAEKFKQLALRKNKIVINLEDNKCE